MTIQGKGTVGEASALTRVSGAAAPRSDAYCSSGSSPTLHILGLGQVGLSVLDVSQQAGLRCVAVSDSGGTAYATQGLDAVELRTCKAARRSVATLEAGRAIGTRLALSVVESDLVADCRATLAGRDARESVADVLAALDSGACVASAAKDACLLEASTLLEPERWRRFGFNAVLGGTGAALKRELSDLRPLVRGLRAVPNATTTAILREIERGESFETAHGRAVDLGLCESNAELDFRGVDAALKLVIVASFLSGTQRHLDEVTLPQDLRSLDFEELRHRAARGLTTRLVASLEAGGELRLEYRAVPRAATLAPPPSNVVYAYDLGRGEQRVHHGGALGARGTASALLGDLIELNASRAQGVVR